MEVKYFLGIDFGHGETSVSRVPGYNGQTVSRVPLRKTNHTQEQKVVSAICQHDDGSWHFVWSKDDFKRPSMREGFKGSIATRSAAERESLRVFAQLVFDAILENDPDLYYDPQSGEANFVICIACPSDWRRQSENTPDEYLRFFRDECGIKPISMCINESDAAFYTKYDKESDNTIFVIDLGSSTIDFTTYDSSECKEEACWGDNTGAHRVEDLLINKAYEDATNVANMRRATEVRKGRGYSSADAAISLATRFAKEEFFTNHLDEFELEVRFAHLIPKYEPKREVAFSLNLNEEAFRQVIKSYQEELELVFANAAKKLSNLGIQPTTVLLSGGASRMDFVLDNAQKAFPNTNIYKDPCPEWVVSDGAAKYAQTRYEALSDIASLAQEFSAWAESNMNDIAQSAALSAFKDAIRDYMRYRLNSEYVNSTSDSSLNHFMSLVIETLMTITSMSGFISKANENFTTAVNGKIVSKLKDIILSRYGKSVEINEVFVDPGDFFTDIPVETDNIPDHIESIAETLFCGYFDKVNWKKSRSQEERQQITDIVIQEIPEKYYAEFSYDVTDAIEQAKANIEKILHQNGLFKVSI